MKKEMKFEVKLTAKELWQFSMYHANAGATGLFNLIFTAAALFLLIFRWQTLTVAYRLLMFGCVLIFTVLQPLLLYGKVRKQAKTPAMTAPMYLTFGEEGLQVEQNGQEAAFTWEQMVHAYLLPGKVLGDQKEAFFELVRAHLPKERRKGF